MNCEYEIEMSFDRKNQSNQSNQSNKLISDTIHVATIHNCHTHFQFTESKDMNQHLRNYKSEFNLRFTIIHEYYEYRK